MMTLYALVFTAGQATADAVQAGKGLSLEISGAVIVAAIGLLGRMEYVVRRAKRNGVKPGDGAVCGTHTRKLEGLDKAVVELQTQVEEREKALDHMRQANTQEHRDINAKLDVLLMRKQ